MSTVIQVIGVAQVINKKDGGVFSKRDEEVKLFKAQLCFNLVWLYSLPVMMAELVYYSTPLHVSSCIIY